MHLSRLIFLEKTWTRWANSFLEERGLRIHDLRTDLSDGILLANLLELVSERSVAIPCPRPKVRAQKLANNSACLQFLRNEGLKVVAVGSEDITDGNLKLILGLLWTLILRGVWLPSKGTSAKQQLLSWVREKIPQCRIPNFTDSWADGRAILSLIEALKPGTLSASTIQHLATGVEAVSRAVSLAESELGIPAIVAAEDVVAAADELSCMTYISYFRDYETCVKKTVIASDPMSVQSREKNGENSSGS